MEEQTTEQTQGTSRSEYSFPYEAQSDHWNVDFGDSKEVYEGADLPLWILVGWATFIIWAVVYLLAGVRTTF